MLAMGKIISSDSAAAGPSAASFTPVAVRARHDGWTPVGQHAFIAARHCLNAQQRS